MDGDEVRVMPDEALVEYAWALGESMKRDRQVSAMLYDEMQARCRDRDARALHGTDHVARIKPGTPTYDIGKLMPLLEWLTAKDLERAFRKEHEETVTVGAKWQGQQLNRIEKDYGGEVAAMIQDARIPGPTSLTLEEA